MGLTNGVAPLAVPKGALRTMGRLSQNRLLLRKIKFYD